MAAIPAPVRDDSIHTSEGRTAPARAPRVEVVAITSDDALLEQIGQALDGESIIRHADSPAEARGLVSPSHPGVLLLDARGYDDLARVAQDLQSQEDSRIVVIFAPAEASDDVARALRGSSAFAVLTIPVDPAQAAAVLEGACEEARARHALLAAPPAAPVPLTPDAPTWKPDAEGTAVPPRQTPSGRRAPARDPATSAPAGGGRTRLIAVLGGLGLLAVAVGGYWLLDAREAAEKGTAASPAVVVPPAVDAVTEVARPEALQTGSLDDLLDSARAAMRARRYTDPEGENALVYYRSVLAQEPDNGEAREGLERIAAVLRERVQTAVAERRFDEASRTLAQLRSIRPGDPAIAQHEASVVDARLRKAVDDGDVERARDLLRQAAATRALPADGVARWQSELDRQQSAARAQQLAGLVSLRIQQGKLLEPANDSARHYLNQLRRLPGDSQARAEFATTELQQAYLGRLKEALAKSQRADAERWKAEARALGVSATELAALQRDVSSRAAVAAASKQEVARVAQLIQERVADNRLLEPAGDSALFHLDALRALDGAANTLATSERAVSAKLMEQARAALAAQRADVAQVHAAAARELGVNLDAVTALERDIAAVSASETAAAKPQAKPLLTRTRYVAPEYPASALKQGLRGNVRVRVTVDAEGRVREADVLASSPPEVFDAAATAAVRKWRFKPIGAKGSGVETTVNVDIVFRPEDARQ